MNSRLQWVILFVVVVSACFGVRSDYRISSQRTSEDIKIEAQQSIINGQEDRIKSLESARDSWEWEKQRLKQEVKDEHAYTERAKKEMEATKSKILAAVHDLRP